MNTKNKDANTRCPNCLQESSIPLEYAGKQIKCKACSALFVAEPLLQEKNNNHSNPPAKKDLAFPLIPNHKFLVITSLIFVILGLIISLVTLDGAAFSAALLVTIVICFLDHILKAINANTEHLRFIARQQEKSDCQTPS